MKRIWLIILIQYIIVSVAEASEVTINSSITKQDVQVAAGDATSFFVRSDGSLWACGDVSYLPQDFPQEVEYYYDETTDKILYLSPFKVMNGVSQVAAGLHHIAILKDDGTLWTCGSNSYGQLGDGTTTKRETPYKLMDDVVSVSAGYGITAFVRKDGTLWTCGKNDYGQLGDNTKNNRLCPVKVMDNVSSVSASIDYMLVVRNDKTLWACGCNSSGQLCDGTTKDKTKLTYIMDNVESVITSHGGLGLCSFIIKTDGSLWSCGYNEGGMLGNGTSEDKVKPEKIMEDVMTAAIGESHSLIPKIRR